MRSARVAAFILVLIFVSTACIENEAGASDTLAPFTPSLRSDLLSHRFVADTDDAAALFVNPAGLGARKNNSSLLLGTYSYDHLSEITSAASMPCLGLGHSFQDNGLFKSNTYLLGLGLKVSRQLYVGTSLRWHHTNLTENRSPFAADLGFLMRPHRFVSIGGVWRNINRPRFGDAASAFLSTQPFASGRLEDTFTGGISIRPMTERITISGQGTFSDEIRPGWQVGGRFSIIPGIELFGAYTRDLSPDFKDPYEEFSAGIAFGLGSCRARSMTRSRVDGNIDYSRNSFAIEKTSSFVRDAFHRRKYAEVTVSGNYLDEGGGFTLMGGSSKNLHRILRELGSIRRDDDVKGLLLKIGNVKSAFIGPVPANLYEIREAVMRVKRAGKPVVAYLAEGGGAAELYLASAADRIVTPREAIVGQISVSLEINRLKRLFAKLGIDWDHYTAGDYKSSFHIQYTDTTTAVQAEELRSLVGESYRLLIEGIAEGRGIAIEKMRELSDGRLFAVDEAVRERLVDVIGWEEDAKEELGKLAGASNPDRLKTVSIAKRKYWTERWKPAPVVAVVGAYGSIESGKSKRDFLRGRRTMGSATVVKQLKAASVHPGVKAIVFRVDSGGGSGLASAEILNEIRRIQEEVKIPVIVSMGNIAGSGGYWISMNGDAIFADPFTITGSIGVVFAKPVFERLYEKVGITNEVFKSGEHADAFSLGRKMTEEEMERLGGIIDDMYDYFIENAAKARKISVDKLRKAAGGRVYLGTQALDLNLIDRLGGLKDAVEYAASEAKIANDYRTVYFRAFPGFILNVEAGNTALGLGRTIKSLWPGRENCFDETLTVF